VTKRAGNGHSLGTAASETPINSGSAEGTVDNRTNGLPAPRLLDYKAAGAYLSLSYWSLRELVLNGEIPCVRFGKKILIDRQDLDAWIEANKETGVF